MTWTLSLLNRVSLTFVVSLLVNGPPLIIEKCAHPDYKDLLHEYYDRSLHECMKRGAGHEPHMLRVRTLHYVVLFGAYCVFFPFLQNAFKVSLPSPPRCLSLLMRGVF